MWYTCTLYHPKFQNHQVDCQHSCFRVWLFLLLLSTLHGKLRHNSWLGLNGFARIIGESLFTGLEHWTGLLDWTTGLTQNGVKCFFQHFQCRREANHVYSAYIFAKFAPLACWANFTGVSRGQRSCAYSTKRLGGQLFWIESKLGSWKSRTWTQTQTWTWTRIFAHARWWD